MDGGHEKVEKYRIRYNFEAYARNVFFLLLSLAFGVAITLVFVLIGGLLGSIFKNRIMGAYIGLLIGALIALVEIFYMGLSFVRDLRRAVHYARAKQKPAVAKGRIIRILTTNIAGEGSMANDYAYKIRAKFNNDHEETFVTYTTTNPITEDDLPAEVKIYRYNDELFASEIVDFPVVRAEALKEDRRKNSMTAYGILAVILGIFLAIILLMLKGTGIIGLIISQ